MIAFLLASIFSATIEGRIVGVVDGDTVDVLVSNPIGTDSNLISSAPKPIRFRLNEIDAPESKQPFGQRAKQALSSKIFGRDVRIEAADKLDRYGREVGTIFLHNENVNAWMVEQGWAWRYDQYSKSAELKSLQDKARREKRGLWSSQESPIPPWEWRKRKRSKQENETIDSRSP
jgi:endonuclease YncB( thermonuclease family)